MKKIVLALLLVVVPAISQAQDEALCAEVKIEILQELTIERQGFEAIMRITNSLDAYAIEDINVTVNFADSDGNSVTATSNTQSTTAEFYIRVDDSNGVSGIQTASNGEITHGEIAPDTIGEMRWLIIPTEHAAQDVNGSLFFVGATLSYSYGGKQETVEVAPDTIVVKPQPKITLDYFLTEEVLGDDSFTTEVEPPVPYTLGVRVVNRGQGDAQTVKIQSAQPRIVENEQGLLADFTILESYLGNQVAQKSLLLDFGDIPAGGIKTGRWVMQTTLSGKFTSLDSRFSHADELGGELTSLIGATNSYLLVRDVLVTQPGRDAVKDYLAKIPTGSGYRLFESENTGHNLSDCDSCADVFPIEATLTGSGLQRTLTPSAVQAGFNYMKVADPYQGTKAISDVYRSDGKRVAPENAWLSKERADNNVDFNYYVNVLDVNPSSSYSVVFGELSAIPQPPFIALIQNREVLEGEQVGFLVLSSDPNRTEPQVTLENPPLNSRFTRTSANTYAFSWFTEKGQAGSYDLRFTANDGLFTYTREVRVQVNSVNDKDNDGMDDSWEEEHFGNTDRDGTGDFDGDGITDLQEFDENTDPKVKALVPTVPKIAHPAYNAVTLVGQQSTPLLPEVAIINSAHPEDMPVWYQFEAYADESLTEQVAMVDAVAEIQGAQTPLQFTAQQLNAEQHFADNHHYFWRARAYTTNEAGQRLYTDWVNSRFFINTQNDAPSQPAIKSPANDAIVSSLKPVLNVENSHDVDGDALHYHFAVYQQPGNTLVAQVQGLQGQTDGVSWQVPVLLEENQRYSWQVTVEDDKGLQTVSSEPQFLVSLQNDSPSEVVITTPQPNSEVSNLIDNNGLWLEWLNAIDPEFDALSYYLELDTVNTFDSNDKRNFGPVVNGENAIEAGSTRLLVENLQENQTYFWRVKAHDGNSDSAWQAASFTINSSNTAPTVPTVVSPGHEAIVETLLPVFEVAPATDPEGHSIEYQFEFYDDANYQNRLGFFASSAVTWPLESALDDNRVYYWQARAVDSKGAASAWAAAQFTTNDNGIDDAPHISWQLPTQDITLSGGLVTIQWQDTDPDSSAVIAVSAVDQAGNETQLATGLQEDADGSADSFSFDASVLAPGSYHLRLTIADATTEYVSNSSFVLHRLPLAGFISHSASGTVLDEAGVNQVVVDVSLQEALVGEESVTVNLQIDDASEAKIVSAGGIEGANYLQFVSQSSSQAGFNEGFEQNELVFRNYYYVDPASSQLVTANTTDFIARVTQDVDNDGDKESAMSIGQDSILKHAIFTDPTPYTSGMNFKVELAIGNEQAEFNSAFRLAFANGAVDITSDSAELLAAHFVDGTLVFGWPNSAIAMIETSYNKNTQYIFELETLSDSVKAYLYETGQARGAAFAEVHLGAAFTFNKGLSVGIFSMSNSAVVGSHHNPIVADNAELTLPGGDSSASLTQSIVLEGVDDCEIDSDQIVNLLFPSIYSNVTKYQGMSLPSQTLTTTDNEFLGQQLFICGYEVVGQQADATGAFVDYQIKPRLSNRGMALLSAQATVQMLGENQQLLGGQQVNFGESGAGVSPVSNETITVRVQGTAAALDTAKLQWQITAGNTAPVTEGSNSNNSLTGTDGNDVINGKAGHDTIYAGAGDDRIIGGAGNDRMYGEAGNDIFEIIGSDTGIDIVNGGDGYDRIVGGHGNDIIRLSAFSGANTVEEIDGGAGNDSIVGSASNNLLDFSATVLKNISVIDGGSGNDTIKGSAFDDTIIGGRGNDTLYGNGGNDSFRVAGDNQGTDKISGGEGFDRIIGSDANDTIRLSTFSGAFTVEQIDGLAGVNTIVGSASNNLLDFSATDLVNIAYIDGKSGNDTIKGSNNNDTIIGGPGNDRLYGNAGNDTFLFIAGNNGVDTFNGGTGVDTIKGTSASDTIAFSKMDASYSIEVIDGDGGFNVLTGSNSNNLLDFRGINLVSINEIHGLSGNDTIYGSEQADVIVGGAGNDTLYGESGDDVFKVVPDDTGANRYNGGEGNDTIDATAASGDIHIVALSSIEQINGQGHYVAGTASNNSLDFSNIILNNIAGIKGLAGNDTLRGTHQADTLIGGPGNDSLYGNGGDDTFIVSANDTGANRYYGGEGFDTVDGSQAGGDIAITHLDSIEQIIGGTNGKAIAGTASNNAMDLSTLTLSNITVIKGLAGNDTIRGTNMADTLIGGPGNDSLYGNAGNDTFIVSADDTGANRYYGGEGIDTIDATAAQGDISIVALTSIEHINGAGQSITGTASNNHLDFSSVTLTNIAAIKGLSGNDTLRGTEQADTLIGGAGNDSLYGNAGDDTFVVSYEDLGANRYYGGDGVDTIDGSGANSYLALATIDATSSIEFIHAAGRPIVGTSSNNRLDFRGVTITGAESLKGLAGNDVIYGTQGQDTLDGGTGNDYLYGEAGDDSYRFTSSSGSDTVSDTQGVNTLQMQDIHNKTDVWLRIAGNNVIVYRSDASARLTLINAVSHSTAYQLVLGNGSTLSGQSLLDYAQGLMAITSITASGYTLTAEQAAQAEQLAAQHGF